MVTFFAQVILPNPCKGIEVGSWEWWLKGCWMLPSEAVVAVVVAGIVGVALWARHMKGGQA